MQRIVTVMLTLLLFGAPQAYTAALPEQPAQTETKAPTISPIAENVLKLYKARAKFTKDSSEKAALTESAPDFFNALSPYAQAKFVYINQADTQLLATMQKSFQRLIQNENIIVRVEGQQVPAEMIINQFKKFFSEHNVQAPKIFKDDMLSKWMHLPEEQDAYEALTPYQKGLYNGAAFVMHPTVASIRKSAFVLGSLWNRGVGYFTSNMCYPSSFDRWMPPTEDSTFRQIIRGAYNACNIEAFGALGMLRGQIEDNTNRQQDYIPTSYKIGPKIRYFAKKAGQYGALTLLAGTAMSAQTWAFGTTTVPVLVMASRILPTMLWSCANSIIDDFAHDTQLALCNGFHERKKFLPKLIEQEFFPELHNGSDLYASLMRMSGLSDCQKKLSFALPAERSWTTIRNALEIVETIGLMELAFARAQAMESKINATATAIQAEQS